ncbi:MAG: SDR family oxidoreductase [Ktedonobacteraceae bacterium]|nr:SDR family oxidoreductase [Ktedonobacteraceae bacterium]MBV9020278.1 SDR family oxidoreductase [Ktedonobacteraceae bacterium]
MKSDTPKVVVITGASAGVGRAIARAFARQGAHIGLLARGHEGLEGARRDVEQCGGKALTIPTDVANPEQVEAAATQVEQTFGPIDIWINDAMASVFSPAKEMKPEEYKRVTEVTYLGTVYGTLAALHRMLPRDKGRIIQIGSALAYRGIPLQSAYCGSKHAIQGFTESVRCELIHDKSNVKITMVQLPAVNTPQFGWVKSRLTHKAQPVPPIYQPEVIAEGVTYVAEHYRRQLFIGTSTVIAIQGNKIAPGYGDHYLGRTGFQSQQTDQPEDPNRPNNLWGPVDEDRDYGAHGTFDERARSRSLELWADTHRSLVGLVAAGVAGVITAAVMRRGK